MSRTTSLALAAVFLAIAVVFVWRSFYGMRITATVPATTAAASTAPTKAAEGA